MRPEATPPTADCLALLPGTDFADAFRVQVAQVIDAPTATTLAFSGMPGWASRLLAVRNRIVAPLGLRTRAEAGPHVGMFPVVQSGPDRVVLGFDDRHLDFRIVVDVSAGHLVTLTTLVRRHNWLGRVYLALVLPFHKRIVPATLARVA